MKYLGINFAVVVKDSYAEKYKARLKETKEDTDRRKTRHRGLEDFSLCDNGPAPRGPQIPCSPVPKS